MRHHHAEVRAHERHRERGRDCEAPHVLRDARELFLRRLLQEGGDPVGVGAGHEGVRPGRVQSLGERVQGGRRGVQHLERRRGRSRGTHQAHGRGGQLLGRRAHRAVRPVLRAVLGLPSRARHGPGVRPGRRLAVHRVLQPGVHGVLPRGGRHHHAAGAQEHRHRHGPGAHGADSAGQAEQLRDGSDSAHHRQSRVDGRHDVRQRERCGEAQAQSDRRPRARRVVPHLRRRVPLQRRKRVRRAPPDPPRRAVRAPPRRRGAGGHRGVHARDRRDRDRDGRRV